MTHPIVYKYIIGTSSIFEKISIQVSNMKVAEISRSDDIDAGRFVCSTMRQHSNDEFDQASKNVKSIKTFDR